MEKVIKFDSLVEMIPEVVEKLSRKHSEEEEEDGGTTDELSKEE
ncbi:MAG: hypothetical protein ABEJ25_04380 [Candidatus Bipolaricaulia bacterium]